MQEMVWTRKDDTDWIKHCTMIEESE